MRVWVGYFYFVQLSRDKSRLNDRPTVGRSGRDRPQVRVSASLVDFLDLLEEVLVRKYITAAGHDLFKADDSLLVDNKVRAPGAVPLFIEDAIGFDHFLSPRVTEKRIIQI